VVKGQWWPELNGKRLFRGVNHGAVLPPTVLAKSRVEPESEPGTVEVFLYPYELTSGDVLEDGPSSTKPMKFSEETMLVWIDLLPTARFAHPTQHVLISKSGVKIVDGQWWPVLNGKMLLRGKNHAAAIPPMVLQ